MAEGRAPVVKGQITIPAGAGGADTRIYLAVPAYGGTFSAEFVQSLFRLLTVKRKAPVDFKFTYFDYADIVAARNYLISDFYYNNPSYTHLLFVDDDMGFDPALIEEMVALKEGVVGVFYPKRKVDLRKLHEAKDLTFEKALAKASEFIGEVRKPMKGKGRFVSVSHCGTGVMLISRGAVETMIEKLPEIVDTVRFRSMPFANKFTDRFITPFDKIKTETAEYSEDYSFCRRWALGCGGTVYAHAQASVRHVGHMTFGAKYSDR